MDFLNEMHLVHLLIPNNFHLRLPGSHFCHFLRTQAEGDVSETAPEVLLNEVTLSLAPVGFSFLPLFENPSRG